MQVNDDGKKNNIKEGNLIQPSVPKEVTLDNNQLGFFGKIFGGYQNGLISITLSILLTGIILSVISIWNDAINTEKYWTAALPLLGTIVGQYISPK